MKKVITYGTYDLLHQGHINLLRRAKELGDYLIVGVTADDFDRNRGKINVQQSLMERIESVRMTGIVDEIIIEEYEGQKIDDIKRLEIDIFTVGSDWTGQFDYLKEFCQVIYLDRTQGISSTELRTEKNELNIALVGESAILNKFVRESHYINGIKLAALFSLNDSQLINEIKELPHYSHYPDVIKQCDAVYIASHPSQHYEQAKYALQNKKHVLCESPMCMSLNEWEDLQTVAQANNCIIMDAIKTAYSTAYYRLLLLVKSGRIGDIVSVDTTCTSLSDLEQNKEKALSETWSTITAWGPTALLPIFQILGTNYNDKTVVTKLIPAPIKFDLFTKIAYIYPHAVASIKIGKGVKSEGELIISGTKGYIYVPAPWWKTDFFELRFENPQENKRYFYQLEGEGIRYMLLNFVKAIQTKKKGIYINDMVSKGIIKEIEDFYTKDQIII